ncbi:MAG: 6-bladed beta-propeller [Longimicrobiales bacterium]
MTSTTMRLVPITLFAAACGGDILGGARWAGTMTDSAGVTIVENAGSGVWEDADRPAVEQELDIGSADADPSYQFGNITGIDVDQDSMIYVVDQQSQTVRVFDAAGAFVREMGGPGSGPGELGQAPAGVFVGPGDTVFVPDMQQQRVVRFTAEGEDAGTFPIPFNEGIPIRWAMTPDAMLVQQSRGIAIEGQTAPPEHDYLLVRDREGVVRDTLLTLPTGASFQLQAGGPPKVRLFEPEPVWALLPEGRTVFGVNSEFDLRVFDRDGSLVRIVRMPFERKPVTEADRTALLRFMREAIMGQAPPEAAPQLEQFLRTIEFADFYPAFASILGGPDGSILVQRIMTADDIAAAGGEFSAQDIGSPIWDVFDVEGRYLGVLELPMRFTPMKVIDGRIWGVWRDELDVQHVLRIRVDANTRVIDG